MKENRSNHRMAPSQVVPKKPYKFYYNQFNDKQNQDEQYCRSASAKKVKQRATGVTDLQAFRKTQLQPLDIENDNTMNLQPFKEALLKNREEKRKENNSAVDFSFEEKEESKPEKIV